MPGISVSNIPIPFSGDGGINWSSYWATLISATVESAAPTEVVLTFPTAQTSLGASDFTIAGFTIASASWAGAVLTLVTSVAVTAYRGNFLITFVKTGTTATVTNNVTMLTTAPWFVSGDGSATYVTKDGSDFVSVVKDLTGGNNHLNQATGTNQPKWEVDGVLYDGIDNFMATAAIATLIRPTYIWLVFKQITYNRWGYILDGLTANSSALQQAVNTPELRLQQGGNISAVNNQLVLNTFGIVKIKFSDGGYLQINDGVASAMNACWKDMLGITFGRSGDLAASYANFKIKEAVFELTDNDAAVRAYLKYKHTL